MISHIFGKISPWKSIISSSNTLFSLYKFLFEAGRITQYRV